MSKGDCLVFLISSKKLWKKEGWVTSVPGIRTSISFGVSSSIWPRGFSSLSTSTLSSSTCSSGEPTGCHPAIPRSPFSRSVLIGYAERGLVLHGRPNLRLFNQLYWVLYFLFFSFFFLLARFSSQSSAPSPSYCSPSSSSPRAILKTQFMARSVSLIHSRLIALGSNTASCLHSWKKREQ